MIEVPIAEARTPNSEHLEPLNPATAMTRNMRTSGVLLHTTSLPGPHGIGDLGPAAFAFVDWLVQAGQSLWQMLPVNPIGPANSPYQSVSAFAGSPLMVALEPLVQQGWLALPALPAGGLGEGRVDYSRVVPWRLAQLRAAAAGFEARASAAERARRAAWCADQADWLDDYALFMALETAQGGQPWWTWPQPLRERDAGAVATARQAQAAEMRFWQFVQWCFDEQLAALKAYANEHDVKLVGDLPIFIAHHSVDCWTRPDLYELDAAGLTTVVAGAPPDSMGPEGQRWGNPLYRWERMAAEGFAWWTARLRRALTQADIFRVDHFRGFAGYWIIPASSPTAVDGHWGAGPGKPLFDAIERALGKLPLIAEDLGLITPDVVALREACAFPGMKILQFGFGGDGTHEFLPHNYEPHVVVYTGTHDNDTARGWWDHAAPHEREFAADYLDCASETVHWAMIRAASQSVAQMAIFPLQDVLGLGSEHRMNLPGSTGQANWSWRVDAAQLVGEPALHLRRISQTSGRTPAPAP